MCLLRSSKGGMPWSGGGDSEQRAYNPSHPALLSPKQGVGSKCVCLRANEVMSNRRRSASGKQIVGQTSSFFSGIIKLADEGNTLDVMNLAFSRALDRGLCRCRINPCCLDMACLGSPAQVQSSWEGLRWGEFCEHLGQALSWRFYVVPTSLSQREDIALLSECLGLEFLSSVGTHWEDF